MPSLLSVAFRYVARVYCLEGRGLTGKDLDGKSDPYVRVKVGDGKEVTARESYCEGTLNPDLFVRLADVPIQIPGPATMEASQLDTVLVCLPLTRVKESACSCLRSDFHWSARAPSINLNGSVGICVGLRHVYGRRSHRQHRD